MSGLSMVRSKFIEAQDLPEGEKVYLRKDFLGWRIIKPIKNEDGSVNWPNLLFGGWRNLLMLLFILALVLLHLHEDKLNIQAVKDNCLGVCRYEVYLNNLYKEGMQVSYINLSSYGGVGLDAKG